MTVIGEPPVPSDARPLKPPAALECDVCIVGAGPAGLTVASELVGTGISVVLLESGGAEHDPAIQELNDGAIVGDEYSGLSATRNRALGGTAHLWNTAYGSCTGAKYAPLDPWDFESPAENGGLPGWPLDHAGLEPYYQRAQARCGLGSFSYEPSRGEDGDRRAWSLSQGSLLCSRLYHFGRGQLFTNDYVTALRAASHVRVREHATVVRLVAGNGMQIGHAEVRDTANATSFTVAARAFVLAGGAIENARLLLVSHARVHRLIAGYDWLGRCFMEHPRDWSLRLVPASPESLRASSFYDAQTNTSGATVCGRLALNASAAGTPRPPNFSVTLLPDVAPATRLVRYLQRFGLAQDRGGYGWSQLADPGKLFSRFRLVINLEQRPRLENRVVLGRETDSLGVPRPELHWCWTAAEQTEWVRTRSRIVAAIEDAGVGTIETVSAGRLDPNAHHHAGTTRMANDPAWGVVDRDCRVHGTSNLYVTGASVFSTAGYANPTLTIVALATRLADHLRAMH